MPTLRETITIEPDEYLSKEVEIDFAMYCCNCNTGICRNTKYRKGTTNEFETHCDKCDTERVEERKKSEETIAELEGNAAELERTIAEMEDHIAELERELEKTGGR